MLSILEVLVEDYLLPAGRTKNEDHKNCNGLRFHDADFI
jgi:hypothetical protein